MFEGTLDDPPNLLYLLPYYYGTRGLKYQDGHRGIRFNTHELFFLVTTIYSVHIIILCTHYINIYVETNCINKA